MPQQEMIFGDYLRVIIKRKWIVLLVTALVILCTYSWAGRKKPVYSSTARIKIQRLQTFAELFDEMLVSSGDPLANYVYEITSHRVLERAAKAMSADGYPIEPADLSGVTAERIEHTDLIDISMLGPTANDAERRCQAVVDAFIIDHDEMTSQNVRAEYEDISKSLVNTMNSLAQQDSELRQQVGERALAGAEYDQGKLLATKLTDAIIRLQTLCDDGNYTEEYPEIVAQKNTINAIKTQLANVSEKELEAQVIIRKYDQKKKILEEMVSYLTRRLEEARIAQTKKSERVQIVTPATPGSKITTARAYLTAVGGLLGLMLGIVLAFIAETMDPSMRTLVEIEETFQLPILGIIPHFSPYSVLVPIRPENFWGRIRYSQIVNSAMVVWRALSQAASRSKKQAGHSSAGKTNMLVVPLSPRAPASEGYRAIRTNLQLSIGNEKVGAILLTSSGPAEGKSTTIANLAFTFAQEGKKTLLVCANMRRPSLYKTLGLRRESGLSEILTGGMSWRETVKDHRDLALGDKAEEGLATAPGAENLFFITCGGRIIQPAELLSLPLFEVVVREWEKEFDVVLIDGTPLLPVPDSVIMSGAIGRVALIYQVGSTQRDSMLRAISLVKNTSAKILGLILNDLRASWTVSPDYYHYRTYYGRPEKEIEVPSSKFPVSG